MINELFYFIGITFILGYVALMVIDRITYACCEINEEDDIY